MLRRCGGPSSVLRKFHFRVWSLRERYQRYFSTRQRDDFNFNRAEFGLEGKEAHDEEIAQYPRITAEELKACRTPPKGIKMLFREFIQDSLYNPHYGYFSSRAEIFSPVQPLEFNEMSESAELDAAVARLYREYDSTSDPRDVTGSRQVWHTPTELFKPYYGYALAQCLVSEYLLKYFPYEDLVIYEIGGGNGTLALNILDFLRANYPEVYDRTQYHIIEISTRLVERQSKLLLPRHPTVQINNMDIFTWDKQVSVPCYFLAVEVIDNFPHDAIRYSLSTNKPYQGLIALTNGGAIQEVWEPAEDALILRYLEYQRLIKNAEGPTGSNYFTPYLNHLRRLLPFAPNFTRVEYLPTKLMTFLELLAQRFPLHRLLLTDFFKLPDTIDGYNAPVVQTRVGNTMIPCSTLAVQPGYFDIFFPTSFEGLRDIYEAILSRPFATSPDRATRLSPMSTAATSVRLGADFFTPNRQKYGRRKPLDGLTSTSGLPIGQRQSFVYTHKEFMEKYADLNGTRLKSGENPILDFYQNVKVLF